MFKKILCNKVDKPKANYLQKTEYYIHSNNDKYNNILFINPVHDKVKKVRGDKIGSLSNDFYNEMFSLKNLPKKYWTLFPIVIFISYQIFFTILQFSKKNSNTSTPPEIYIYTVFLVLLIYFIRECKEKEIIKKYNKKNSSNFLKINDVRVDWLRRRVGENRDFYELAKEIVKWKKIKNEFNLNYQFQMSRYIYDSQSKPRLLALIISLISIITLIVINSINTEKEILFFTLLEFKRILFEEIGILIFIILTITLLFLGLMFLWSLLCRLSVYIFDLFSANGKVSNLRFKILLNFLLDNSYL